MNHVKIAALILIFIFVLSLLISFKIKSKKQITKSPISHGRPDVKISEEHKKKPIEISESHKKYRDKSYKLICSDEVFSNDEIDILTEYGSWLNALASEKIEPETESQREFINLCKNYQTLSLSEMLKNLKSIKSKTNNIQYSWFKYLCRIQLERENPEFIKNRQQEVSATDKDREVRRTYDIKRQIEIQMSLPDTVQRNALVKILERELARLKA